MRSKIGHLLHKSGHFDSDMHTTVPVSILRTEAILQFVIPEIAKERSFQNQIFD